MAILSGLWALSRPKSRDDGVRVSELPYGGIEARAAPRWNPGLRLSAWKGPGEPERPAALVPIITTDGVRIRGDQPAALFADPELVASLKALAREADRIDLLCDGEQVVGRAWQDHWTAALEPALRNTVRRIAAWDDGLTKVLSALPGATPCRHESLDPAFVIAPGDVVIGISPAPTLVVIRNLPANHGIAPDKLDPATHVRAARAGDGELMIHANSIRFIWRGAERDPERLQAAIDALRNAREAADGPYR